MVVGNTAGGMAIMGPRALNTLPIQIRVDLTGLHFYPCVQLRLAPQSKEGVAQRRDSSTIW